MSLWYRILQSFICLSAVLIQIKGQGQSNENERFLPTFTPIEPDLGLRSSLLTDRSMNGTTSSENLSKLKEPSRSLETASGQKITIFDNVLDFKLLNAVQTYCNFVASWEFKNTKADDCVSPSPWFATLDLEPFESSALLSVVKEHLVVMDDGAPNVFLPYSISLHVFRRGDQVYLMRDSRDGQTERSVLLFFNHFWRKNDYGELLFYDDDNDSFAAVSPKYNRMVVWDSSIGYIHKPPSMDFKQGMVCLKLKFTTNETKHAEAQQSIRRHIEERTDARRKLFSEMKGSEVKSLQDVRSRLTMNFTTHQGKRVYVFDGIFNEEDLMKLRNFVPRHGHFYFDDSLDLDSDNVQWIAGFKIDDYAGSKMWPATRKVAQFVSGTDQWYPYDISCNLLRTYDYTRIHEDCEQLEKEWTFLVYLATNWSADNYGETNFMHFKEHGSEHVISVIPRFGRVVIFEGIIPHSARPPSPAFNDARLTFVAKLSINEWVARVKSLKTEFGHEAGMHQECLGLFRNYHDKDYEEQYKLQLLENAEELKEINSLYAKREEEEGEEGKDEDEKTPSSHQFVSSDEEATEEYAEYDETHFADDEMYPDVQMRKSYIMKLVSDRSQDVALLREHYAQFLLDMKAIEEKYVKQLEKLI
ncbi:uncharacterized protein [Diadema antillarum]|uniref:uncharacterized protein n=1 Tax=Diadema antillarum TaxID=105358 RepID=UPI003A8BF94E